MKHALLLLSILLLFACKNDPDPTPVDIITYTDERAFGDQENWILAWNSKGELLDYKKYDPGEVVTLKSTGDISDNKITIGLLNYSNSNNYASHDMVIYTDITPGQTFAFKAPSVDDPNPNIDATKTFSVNLPSDGAWRFLNISDATGYYNFGQSDDQDFHWDPVITSASEYNIMYRNYDGLRHKILSDVSAGDVFDLTKDDFTPYEHEVTYTFPPGQINFILYGYTSATPVTSYGVFLDFLLTGYPSTSLTTGYYGSSFTRFSTWFNYTPNNSHTSFDFNKIGSLPTEMNIPEAVSFPVTNKDPFNMSISAPSTALFHQVKWGNQLYEGSGPKTTGYVQWTITGTSPDVTIGPLPDEILAAYPLLNIDASHYLESTIFLGPQTYSEYSTRKLNRNMWDEFEQSSLRAWEPGQ